MKAADYFVRKLREDTQLRSSCIAYLKDWRDEILKEMVTQESDQLLRTQGAVRGIDRLVVHLIKKDVMAVEDGDDERAIRRVR